MTLPIWMLSPSLWIIFWASVGLLVLIILYFSIASSLRQIEEAEAELDANEHMTHVGSNIWVIFPDFHNPDGRGGDAA